MANKSETVEVVLSPGEHAVAAPVIIGRLGQDKAIVLQPGSNQVDAKVWAAIKGQENVKAMGSKLVAYTGRA